MEIVSMYSIGMLENWTPTPGFLVWRLSMKWRAAVDRAVAPLELTHAQYSMLASLYGMVRAGERPSQRRLADHTGLEPIYVSKLVRALEAAGLVERAADPADSRAIRLALTEAGSDVAERAIAVVRDLQDELTAPLGGTQGRRTQNLVRELQTLLAAPSPPNRTGDHQ
jgi:MarR family transcriptional regulator, organic hydroperoxide resistance regulator